MHLIDKLIMHIPNLRTIFLGIFCQIITNILNFAFLNLGCVLKESSGELGDAELNSTFTGGSSNG